MYKSSFSMGAFALAIVIVSAFLLGPMETDALAKKRKYQKCDLSSETA